jgi:photosystem II stability/assembly factor-like uncharacterized protein
MAERVFTFATVNPIQTPNPQRGSREGNRKEHLVWRHAGHAALILLAVASAGVIVKAGYGQSGGQAISLGALAPTPGPRLSARTGAYVWAVGEPRYVFASANGGSTWTTIRLPSSVTKPAAFRDVTFSDARHGWAVGENTAMATCDGGQTWKTRLTLTSGFLRAVGCADARHIWAVGDQGDGSVPLVLASTDGGKTWSAQRLAVRGSLAKVVFVDQRHGWVAGRDSNSSSDFVLTSSDGGGHWRLQYRTAWPSQISGLAATDPLHAWLVGWSAGAGNRAAGWVLATSDGGDHWKAQLAGASGSLLSVDFPDASHGWVVGSEGAVFATTDGGRTWVAQRSGVNQRNLSNVTFSDATHGWAVVDKWGLLATQNGGRTWNVVLPGEPGSMVWAATAVDTDASH